MKWESASIQLPAIGEKIVSSSVLNGGDVSVKQTENGVEIFVPEHNRDKYDTIVMLEVGF